MSIRLQQQVEELSRKVTDQDQRIEGLVQRLNELEKTPAVAVTTIAHEVATEPQPKKQKLCPKCNEAQGYFFHVRSCKGPKPA